MAMKVAQLRDVADELELDHADVRKADLITMILEEIGLSTEPAPDAPF